MTGSLKLLVTGAAGFIGSMFAEQRVQAGDVVIALDKLTYAGHRENIQHLDEGDGHFQLVVDDIRNSALVLALLQEHQVDAVVHFAAESHVDHSIHSPAAFIETNVLGTYSLLEAARSYYNTLKGEKKDRFRFLHVSTDEVFGALGDTGKFTEQTPYNPHSPYSASKAASDHLARAWCDTYGLPTIVTNCSNNYGPRQFPEKLIPLMICEGLEKRPMPVYGEGKNVRDWIHVSDHCNGIHLALTKGKPGETYCFGGNAERRNLEVVETICTLLDEIKPRPVGSYKELIKFVQDRAGHDWRYAIDDTKAERELGFTRKYDFATGLKDTVRWYVEHQTWCNIVRNKAKKAA